MSLALLRFTVWFSLISTAHASDGWPQYNGPDSARRLTEEIAHREWAADGPPVRWRSETDAGFSSFTISGGRVFTLVTREGAETLVALSADSGDELWATTLSRSEYDGGGEAGASGNRGGDGPRSTPSVDGGLVFAYDSAFVVTALRVATGELVWRQDLVGAFDGQSLRWQNAASPLVEDGLVMVAGGGPGKTFLAFDAQTGEVKWASGDEAVTHATPIATTLHGRRQILFYVQSGLVACDPKDGRELWRVEYPYKVSSAASPVVYGDLVYVSAGYGVGAGVFRVLEEDGAFRGELVWQKRNKLMNHWSTPVCKDGYLYGMFSFKKYGEGPLCCVSLEDGETLWAEPGFGPGNVIAAGETLVALSDAGEVVLVDLKPDSYRELARAKLLDGKCWSSPACAAGQLYVRSTQEGVRVDLTSPSK